ncbi:MAG TPA: ATP-binding cassette domain-containing protein [Quisquiliibacterium sp.]|nr:ATP-binding cassette domain-containing protein [Quisquiliibacterium sp.]HPA89340.1 ATP-binding cassette domain-containing protein [Quisquiliibacterium sp.]HQN12329.1 ATP-binding cassette domain-containing protein [Quisquiliibacterium sp.]HQP67768.1 ATP-binding cassette domain-containing protein [Quisquiliibacterium sp.]
MAGSGTAHLTGDDALLTARHLVKTFHAKGGRRVQALSDVSLELRRGETLGVVGESGSGKSTLARALMALPAPDSGSVTFAGQEVFAARGAALRALRFRMQMVFQDPMSSLNPAHSILDVVEMPLLVAGRGDAKQRRAAALKTLRSVGLDGELIGQRRSYELSGGQCQRVSIARALMLGPDLLVCDEPVSALDVSVQAQVLNLLEDAKAEHGLTMLFISHDLGVVKGISDRVMVMYLGKVCEIAPADALYAQPRHPYSATLLASVPSLTPTRRAARPALARGETPSPLAVPSGCRFRTRCPRATDRCVQEEPQIAAAGGGPGHFVACHHPLQTPAEAGVATAS